MRPSIEFVGYPVPQDVEAAQLSRVDWRTSLDRALDAAYHEGIEEGRRQERARLQGAGESNHRGGDHTDVP